MPLSYTDDPEAIAFIVDRLVNNTHKLTEWEGNFIKSINEQIDADKDLTDKQKKVLSNIWEEY